MHECIDRFSLPGRSFLDVQNESLLGYHVILTGYGKTGLLFTSVQYNETFNEVGEKYIHEKPNQQKKKSNSNLKSCHFFCKKKWWMQARLYSLTAIGQGEAVLN